MRVLALVVGMMACGPRAVDPAPAPVPARPPDTVADAGIAAAADCDASDAAKGRCLPPAVDWPARSPQHDELVRALASRDRAGHPLALWQRGREIRIESGARTAGDIAAIATLLAANPMFAHVTVESGERQPDGSYRFAISLEAPDADPTIRTYWQQR